MVLGVGNERVGAEYVQTMSKTERFTATLLGEHNQSRRGRERERERVWLFNNPKNLTPKRHFDYVQARSTPSPRMQNNKTGQQACQRALAQTEHQKLQRTVQSKSQQVQSKKSKAFKRVIVSMPTCQVRVEAHSANVENKNGS